MMKEKWKDISGFDGIYQISDCGRVRNFMSGKILKPHINNNGYQLIWLSIGCDGKKKRYTVHRLAAFHFLPPHLASQEIHHKDGNKTNNNASNLEWVSRSENMKAIYDNYNKKGKKIIHLPTGKLYNSISHAARDMNCSMVNISLQLRGLRKNSLNMAYVDDLSV